MFQFSIIVITICDYYLRHQRFFVKGLHTQCTLGISQHPHLEMQMQQRNECGHVLNAYMMFYCSSVLHLKHMARKKSENISKNKLRVWSFRTNLNFSVINNEIHHKVFIYVYLHFKSEFKENHLASTSLYGGTSPNQCANGVTMNKFRQK